MAEPRSPTEHRATRAAALTAFGAPALTGYLTDDEIAPGEPLRLHVSGPAGPAELRVLRAGPPEESADSGWGERPVPWASAQRLALREQELARGSYLAVDPAPGVGDEFTFAMWCRPTLLRGGWHALAWQGSRGRVSWCLLAGADGVLAGGVGPGRATWCVGKDPLEIDSWQLVAFTFDGPRNRLAVTAWCPQCDRPPRTDAVPLPREATPAEPGRLLLGAFEDAQGAPAGCFNGRVARPLLVARAVPEEDLEQLVEAAGAGDPALIAAWPLARGVGDVRIVDASGNGHDARACNAPLRAVTGPAWRGRSGRRYGDAPGDYDAVHLHEDDLDDAAWPVTAELAVAGDARPGIHLARLSTDDDELCLPFVVRSAQPTEPLAFVAPTLTWQAYASNRPAHEHTEDGVLDAVGALYDLHPDGTPRHLTSRLRPTRAGAPERGIRAWGAHTVAADLMICAGLERLGFAHDVLADRQLHSNGVEALRPYRCVVLGAHPEYTTAAMMDALDAYMTDGGRIVYLGGNGLYWVTSIDAARPHLIEVRKGGLGEAPAPSKHCPGEAQHQTTLEDGGFWTERGRPARALLGVEFTSNCHADGSGVRGFERLESASDPRFAWVFAGVTDEDPIGAYGANLGSAAGYEMDAVQPWTWSDQRPAPVVLARAAHGTIYGPRDIPVSPRAELALRVLPNGGATFAAGSVTWSGSLAHDGYDNGVARITANVLRRFCEAPAGEPVA